MDEFDTLSSSDEEEASSGRVLQLLRQAWASELHCPDILKHESDLVDCMMDQIHQMEENLRPLKRDDFRWMPHRMEVDRIRYLLCSYLRTRLKKIEKYATYFVERDSAISSEEDRFMSKAEYDFALTYAKDLQQHMDKELYKYLPQTTRQHEQKNELAELKPNLNESVFIKMEKTVGHVLVCDQFVELTSGSRYLLPYKDVEHLVRDGSAVLI